MRWKKKEESVCPSCKLGCLCFIIRMSLFEYLALNIKVWKKYDKNLKFPLHFFSVLKRVRKKKLMFEDELFLDIDWNFRGGCFLMYKSIFSTPFKQPWTMANFWPHALLTSQIQNAKLRLHLCLPFRIIALLCWTKNGQMSLVVFQSPENLIVWEKSKSIVLEALFWALTNYFTKLWGLP